MDEKDPNPFGYTFSKDFFDEAPDFSNGGPALLSEMESQGLSNFFDQTNWSSELPAAPEPSSMSATDFKDPGWDFAAGYPPATIHSVSTMMPNYANSNIPSQPQLNGFQHVNDFVSPHSIGHFDNTADDLQAASTLFANTHMPQSQGRFYNFHDTPQPSLVTNDHPTSPYHNMPTSAHSTGVPMVPTSNGLLHEQLAALLPNHEAAGSIDASIALQFAQSSAQRRHETDLREHGHLHRPSLKRTYTYGTDRSFNESGFQAAVEEEDADAKITNRLIEDLRYAQPLVRPAKAATHPSSNGHAQYPSASADMESDEENQSDEAQSDDDEDDHVPIKKRRKSKALVAKNGKRKSVSTTARKTRKMSIADGISKKKRGSTAGNKADRQNLTDSQKRHNHILSEQKRRTLIKRGFDDLHDLVPAIRVGGLSKSGILSEAANFLEGLIADNERYLEMIGDAKS